MNKYLRLSCVVETGDERKNELYGKLVYEALINKGIPISESQISHAIDEFDRFLTDKDTNTTTEIINHTTIALFEEYFKGHMVGDINIYDDDTYTDSLIEDAGKVAHVSVGYVYDEYRNYRYFCIIKYGSTTRYSCGYHIKGELYITDSIFKKRKFQKDTKRIFLME